MVVLDVTIVNIALPSAQRELGFSDDDRQWVITAYALTFGSLLLLGGRIADLFGRKWTFIGGLLGFAGASAVGGAAQSFGVLVGARTLQGAFGAMLAPAALSLLTTTFTDPRTRQGLRHLRRHRRHGRRHRPAARRSADRDAGLALVPVRVDRVRGPGGDRRLAVAAPRGRRARPRLDLPGTLTASSGLFALVFGLFARESDGWGDPSRRLLVAGAVLLVAFVAIQRRVANPLLPLRVVADRARGGSFLAIGIASAGIFGLLLFLTFYLQDTKGLPRSRPASRSCR